MTMKEQTIEHFLTELSAKQSTPGAGGAAALVAALGSSLGSMVGNFTIGKKKYQAVDTEVKKIVEELEQIKLELEELIQKDADAFYPLAQAYKLPKETPEEIEYKDKVMEEVLEGATTVPIDIMKKTVRAIELLERVAKIGNTRLTADAGTGILFCKAALEGASLSVYINTTEMQNKQKRHLLNQEAERLVEKGSTIASNVYQMISQSFKLAK